MVADPFATAVTSPEDETVAISVSDDDHVTVAPDITDPPASFTVAVTVSVPPMVPNVTESWESSRVAGTWETVTAAVPVIEPVVAVMMAVPLVTAVTSPAAETGAMDAAEVDHVTVAPDITDPPVSFTVALSVTVSLNDAKVVVLGETSTVDTTCPTVTADVPVAVPEVAVIVAEPLATAVTVPEDETVATDAEDVAHDTLAPLIVAPL